jgi:5'-methylthioadenosine phosphorylase
MEQRAEIGIIGGSGFYSLLENAQDIDVETPYGPPSDLISLGEIAGRKVAFLPRHGKHHQLPPHMINYRANIWALKSLGVRHIIAPTAVGSLQPDIKVGDLVITDQFIDRTRRADTTFYNGPVVTHVSTADPYCPVLNRIAVATIKSLSLPVHDGGTCVVIEGPRFSTKAESNWFTRMGWHTVNMTQYPEVTLAREQAMCYCNISVITDYDAGLVAEGAVDPVSNEAVIKAFTANLKNLVTIIEKMIPQIPGESEDCTCFHALDGASIG